MDCVKWTSTTLSPDAAVQSKREGSRDLHAERVQRKVAERDARTSKLRQRGLRLGVGSRSKQQAGDEEEEEEEEEEKVREGHLTGESELKYGEHDARQQHFFRSGMQRREAAYSVQGGAKRKQALLRQQKVEALAMAKQELYCQEREAAERSEQRRIERFRSARSALEARMLSGYDPTPAAGRKKYFGRLGICRKAQRLSTTPTHDYYDESTTDCR